MDVPYYVTEVRVDGKLKEFRIERSGFDTLCTTDEHHKARELVDLLNSEHRKLKVPASLKQ